jgi:hypothetical protein
VVARRVAIGEDGREGTETGSKLACLFICLSSPTLTSHEIDLVMSHFGFIGFGSTKAVQRKKEERARIAFSTW